MPLNFPQYFATFLRLHRGRAILKARRLLPSSFSVITAGKRQAQRSTVLKLGSSFSKALCPDLRAGFLSRCGDRMSCASSQSQRPRSHQSDRSFRWPAKPARHAWPEMLDLTANFSAGRQRIRQTISISFRCRHRLVQPWSRNSSAKRITSRNKAAN